MGERRAEVRSDASGSELRIEDRWATVRREDDRGSSGGSDRAETRRERREREEARSAESRPIGRRAAPDDEDPSWSRSFRERPVSPPALPAGGVPAPSWATGWSDESPANREREREPVERERHREREREREPVDRERHGEREPRAARRRRDDDDDDRWEREPTDPGRARPRRLDFELTDDRWN
jgi:hypothetical protein